MRTARLLPVSPSMHCAGLGGRYLPKGVYLLRGCTCLGVPDWGEYLPRGDVPAWGLYLLGVYLPRGLYLLGSTCWGGCTCLGGVPAGGVYLLGGVYMPGGVPALGMYLPRGVYLLGGVPAWGCTCKGVYLPWGCTCQGGVPAGGSTCWGGVPALGCTCQGGVPAWGCTCQGVCQPCGCTCQGGCTCREEYLPGGLYLPGVYLLGGLYLPGGCTSPGGVLPRYFPPVNRILDTRFWKYYLATTSLRAVKIVNSYINCLIWYLTQFLDQLKPVKSKKVWKFVNLDLLKFVHLLKTLSKSLRWD